MRKFLKFAHTMGGIGLTGGLLAMIVMLWHMPETADLVSYATVRTQMALVAQWIIFPSLIVVLVGGLLAMAWNNTYINAGWVWLKLALGLSTFEGTLLAVQGPARREAERAAQALAGELEPDSLGLSASSEFNSAIIILLIAIINVVLAIWRPRFSSNRSSAA